MHVIRIDVLSNVFSTHPKLEHSINFRKHSGYSSDNVVRMLIPICNETKVYLIFKRYIRKIIIFKYHRISYLNARQWNGMPVETQIESN